MMLCNDVGLNMFDEKGVVKKEPVSKCVPYNCIPSRVVVLTAITCIMCSVNSAEAFCGPLSLCMMFAFNFPFPIGLLPLLVYCVREGNLTH